SLCRVDSPTAASTSWLSLILLASVGQEVVHHQLARAVGRKLRRSRLRLDLRRDFGEPLFLRSDATARRLPLACALLEGLREDLAATREHLLQRLLALPEPSKAR